MIAVCLPHIYSSWIAEIFSITAKLIIIFEAYKNFENISLTKNASYSTVHQDYNYLIDSDDNQQPTYRLIYRLSEKKLFIFQAYIDKILANQFINVDHSHSEYEVI